MTYRLLIKFKSNEAPWEGTDEPLARHQPQTDEEAKDWAQGMQEGLYDYTVTLFKDGEVLNYERGR